MILNECKATGALDKSGLGKAFKSTIGKRKLTLTGVPDKTGVRSLEIRAGNLHDGLKTGIGLDGTGKAGSVADDGTV